MGLKCTLESPELWFYLDWVSAPIYLISCRVGGIMTDPSREESAPPSSTNVMIPGGNGFWRLSRSGGKGFIKGCMTMSQQNPSSRGVPMYFAGEFEAESWNSNQCRRRNSTVTTKYSRPPSPEFTTSSNNPQNTFPFFTSQVTSTLYIIPLICEHCWGQHISFHPHPLYQIETKSPLYLSRHPVRGISHKFFSIFSNSILRCITDWLYLSLQTPYVLTSKSCRGSVKFWWYYLGTTFPDQHRSPTDRSWSTYLLLGEWISNSSTAFNIVI